MNNTKPRPRITAFFFTPSQPGVLLFQEQSDNCWLFFQKRRKICSSSEAAKGAGCSSTNNQLDFPEPEGCMCLQFLGPEHGFKMYLCCLSQMNSQFK